MIPSTLLMPVKSDLERKTADKTLTVMDWPPQSPDQHIIEAVWDHLDRERNEGKPNSKEELWEVLKEAYYNMPDDYGNLPARLLQLPSRKSTSHSHPAATAHLECCSLFYLQPSKIFTSCPCYCYSTGYQLLLGSNSDSGPRCSQQDVPSLPTGHHSGQPTSSTNQLCCHRPPCSSCQLCDWLSLVPTAELYHLSSPRCAKGGLTKY